MMLTLVPFIKFEYFQECGVVGSHKLVGNKNQNAILLLKKHTPPNEDIFILFFLMVTDFCFSITSCCYFQF